MSKKKSKKSVEKGADTKKNVTPDGAGSDAANKPPEKPPVEEKAPAVKKPPEQLFAMRVFEKVAGVKPDQIAGFKNYAKRKGLGPLSIKDWKAEYKKFVARPTT